MKTETYAMIRKYVTAGDYAHIRIAFYTAEPMDIDLAVKKQDFPHDVFRDPMDGIHIQNQYHRGCNGAYGYSVVYGKDGADIEDIERVVKSMRKIEKGLTKFTIENGVPKDYVDYIYRIFTTLKIKRAFFPDLPSDEKWKDVTESLFKIKEFDEAYKRGEY